MSERSSRFAFPFLAPGQAQKEVFHNEALAAIDGALHACVETISLAEPPATPVTGEAWIVASSATGAWAGREESLAVWGSGGWRFIPPVPGMLVWNKASDYWVHWTGAGWADGAWPVATLAIGGQQVVGPRLSTIANPSGGTTIDGEARAAIEGVIVALKTHGLIE